MSNHGKIVDIWVCRPDFTELKTTFSNGRICFVNQRKMTKVSSLVRHLFPTEYIIEDLDKRIMDNYKRYLAEDIEALASKRFYKIDKVTYRSLREASKGLGTPIGTIKSRLESTNFGNYTYI